MIKFSELSSDLRVGDADYRAARRYVDKKRTQVILKDADGHFKKGGCPNPTGRPRGSKNKNGRRKCLQTLDIVTATAANQKILALAIEMAFRQDPIKFMKRFILPLLTKEMLESTHATTAAVPKIINALSPLPTSEPDNA